MKALVHDGGGQILLEDRPEPVVSLTTDAIVRMTKTTLCGTDLQSLTGDTRNRAPGRVLGHEGVGVIHAKGTDVRRFDVGDHVLIAGITSCGTCDYCLKQIYGHCREGGRILGRTIDGTQAEFVRIPHAENSLYAIPAVADEDALVTLSDILPTSFECSGVPVRIRPGSAVAIVGAGPIGLAALLMVRRHAPAAILMIDIDDNRLKVAETFGATALVNSADEPVRDVVMALTQGRGVDIAIEAVGVIETFALCERIVAGGGTIANVGIHGTQVNLFLDRLWHRNITLTTHRADAPDTPAALAGSGHGRAASLLRYRFELRQILYAYDVFGRASANRALKVIVDI